MCMGGCVCFPILILNSDNRLFRAYPLVKVNSKSGIAKSGPARCEGQEFTSFFVGCQKPDQVFISCRKQESTVVQQTAAQILEFHMITDMFWSKTT